ncbi:MAG: nicotinate-nucleotide adenylyltransferase [Proteobacteria bacterium]|nr:nicotinate-nucleotide adenylyltransferase [Pseudomonadota bacterium]
MKIGIFGGTFNPIHNGHIRVACDVKSNMDLDEIWFLCASQPPHKKVVVPDYHRMNMIKLALKDFPYFLPCDIEIKNKFRYTIDTINFINKKYGKEYKFYFLVGFDAFIEINTWKDWKSLFSSVNFVIFNRYGVQDKTKRILKNYLKLEIDEVSAGFYLYKDREIHNIYVKSLNISGSEIRELIRKDLSISSCVGRDVASYIKANNLYREIS